MQVFSVQSKAAPVCRSNFGQSLLVVDLMSSDLCFFAPLRQITCHRPCACLYFRRFKSLTNLIMTKQDLIASIAATAGITKKTAAMSLEALTDYVTKELKKGKNVTITGFGTFRVSKRAARTGVNPRNPTQRIKIPAMNIPAFKAGKSLKDAIR